MQRLACTSERPDACTAAVTCSRSASGITIRKFFAPPAACTRLPCFVPVSYMYFATGVEPTNETAPHQRMRQEHIHALFVAMHDIENAGGATGFEQEFTEQVGGQGYFFARLENERVAADQGDGKHPEGHDCGEIIGSDACANAEGMADGFCIDIARQIRQGLAHQMAGNAAGKLDDLDAALDAGAGFDGCLAVLARD